MALVTSVSLPLLKAARSLKTGKKAYVFATESAGSVGDQAMADVIQRILADLFGYEVVVINMPGWTATETRAESSQLTLPTYGRRSLTYWRLFADANLLVAVGADVIDGHYGIGLPGKWLADLRFAQALGIPNGAINFSFSEQAAPEICNLIGTMPGTKFVSRDPVSRGRFEKATGHDAAVSADLAFLLVPEITSVNGKAAHEWAAGQKARGRTVLAVNASGHTLEKMAGDGIAAYGAICRAWLEADPARAIILVPHDYRPAPVGDVEALSKIADSLGDFGERVHFLRPYFAAWEVKAICEHVDLALTGRMHFAIAALGMGAPALNISYVGKFEGLMQHCELQSEDLVIEPAAVLDVRRMTERLETLSSKAARLRPRILARVPAIQSLSRQNFAWIRPCP